MISATVTDSNPRSRNSRPAASRMVRRFSVTCSRLTRMIPLRNLLDIIYDNCHVYAIMMSVMINPPDRRAPLPSTERSTMQKTLLAAAFALAALSADASLAAPAAYQDPLDGPTLSRIGTQFARLMALANQHDIDAIHGMFWQSPASLLVAKSAIPADGNWAGFWGNDAIDRKLHDIAELKIVGLTPEVAESYAPLTITVSYAGQDGTPKPFLLIIDWIKVANDWKIASEIILPVPPAPPPKG